MYISMELASLKGREYPADPVIFYVRSKTWALEACWIPLVLSVSTKDLGPCNIPKVNANGTLA